MAEGNIRCSNGSIATAFIYEGERIAVEYPDGTTFEIPPHKVHTVLLSAILPSGEECKILLEKTPVSRLDIVTIN